MIKGMRFRFWLESVLATITSVLFVFTLVWRDWIERIFNIDLDNHNGSIEWLIVGALFIVTVSLFYLARYEWRIAHTVPLQSEQ